MVDDRTMDIGAVDASEMQTAVDDVLVDREETDAATGDKETTYINTDWSQQYAYYKKIAELKAAIDARALWTIGRGFEADTRTTVFLEQIKGHGKETFNSILKNMIITRRIGGDAFAEIIRDPQTNDLINLKVLDPGQIKIVANSKGIIIRYEQVSKHDSKKAAKIFQPNQIFHLVNKRVADSIAGTSDIESLEPIIKALNENFEDMKQLMHRHVRPMHKFSLDTDDTTKIAALVTKFDAAVNKGENIYIPKGTVEQELVAVPSNATLNPLPWHESLKNRFYQVVSIPQIIMGGAAEFSESSAKIAYLSFQQSVEDEQLDIQEQLWNQIYIRIKLTFPASLQHEMLSDTAKDGQEQQTGFQANDVIAGVGE